MFEFAMNRELQYMQWLNLERCTFPAVLKSGDVPGEDRSVRSLETGSDTYQLQLRIRLAEGESLIDQTSSQRASKK
jgi:hypothetical protein